MSFDQLFMLLEQAKGEQTCVFNETMASISQEITDPSVQALMECLSQSDEKYITYSHA